METKRKRKVNFCKTEEELLIELVKKYEQIIENKKTDAVVMKESKACWVQVAEEFNSVVFTPRTIVQLQQKYSNLKKVLRKSATIK